MCKSIGGCTNPDHSPACFGFTPACTGRVPEAIRSVRDGAPIEALREAVEQDREPSDPDYDAARERHEAGRADPHGLDGRTEADGSPVRLAETE